MSKSKVHNVIPHLSKGIKYQSLDSLVVDKYWVNYFEFDREDEHTIEEFRNILNYYLENNVRTRFKYQRKKRDTTKKVLDYTKDWTGMVLIEEGWN